ncbi:MAG: hypothetical protein IKT32_00745 [Clostridia bacterium]|nr:hypothetical protein [Clostridia bacterium]
MQTLPHNEIPAQVIETRNALESRYDCYIFLYHERQAVYMSVIATNKYRCHLLLLADKADAEGISAAMQSYFREVSANANIVS